MTEELILAIKNAKTDEEKKLLLKEFKDEIKTLTEEELNFVAGGRFCPCGRGKHLECLECD